MVTHVFQIRALFPIVRQEDELGRIDLSLLRDWFLFLSPDQIRRFRNGLELMSTVKERQHDFWTYPSHIEAFSQPSVPTLRQVSLVLPNFAIPSNLIAVHF